MGREKKSQSTGDAMQKDGSKKEIMQEQRVMYMSLHAKAAEMPKEAEDSDSRRNNEASWHRTVGQKDRNTVFSSASPRFPTANFMLPRNLPPLRYLPSYLRKIIINVQCILRQATRDV